MECLVEAALDCLEGHALAVVGDAYVAHLTLSDSLLHRLIQAGAIIGFGAVGRIVELIEIHIVGTEQAQACLEIAPEALGGGGAGLGADNHLVASAFESYAEFFLAVGVEAGGVEVVHTAVESTAYEAHGISLADALYGQSPEAVARHHEAAASKSYLIIHIFEN